MTTKSEAQDAAEAFSAFLTAPAARPRFAAVGPGYREETPHRDFLAAKGPRTPTRQDREIGRQPLSSPASRSRDQSLRWRLRGFLVERI